MQQNRDNIANQITEAMKDQRYNIHTLSKDTSISVNTIRRILQKQNQKGNYSIDNIFIIAQKLNIQIIINQQPC